MSISIENARKRLYSAYNIDVDKYTSDETVDELSDRLESIPAFGLSIILPVIIVGVVSLLSAITLAYLLHSVAFGILFFLFSIPIFLIGTGSLRISKAIKNLYEGVSYILTYSANIANDIGKNMVTEGKMSKAPKDLSLLVLYGIVFPIVKKIVRKKSIGGIMYFVIEKAVNRGARKIDCETENIGETLSLNRHDEKETAIVSEKMKRASEFALKSVVNIFRVIGIVFICIGVILISILCFVFI